MPLPGRARLTSVNIERFSALGQPGRGGAAYCARKPPSTAGTCPVHHGCGRARQEQNGVRHLVRLGKAPEGGNAPDRDFERDVRGAARELAL